MFKLKEWFSKYGVVAPCAVVAIIVMVAVAVVQTYGAVGNGDQVTEEVGIALTRVPQPVVLSQEEVARIAREEIAARRKLDEECREVWRALLPKLAEGAKARWDIAFKCQADIDSMVKNIRDSIDASEFADAACGWESSWTSLDGWDVHSDWLKTQFRATVIDEAVLADGINKRLQQLHEELIQFDANMMATLAPDSHDLLAKVEVPETHLAWVMFSFVNLIGTCRDSLDKAWVESGVSYVGGELLSGVAAELFSGGQQDSSGSRNPAIDLLTDFAADAVASELVEHAISTSRTDLENEIEGWTRMQLDLVLSEQGGLGWLTEMQQMVLDHEHVVTDGLQAASGTEREWAFSLLERYCNFLRNQETSNE